MQLWVIAAVVAVAAGSSTAKTGANQLSSVISKDDSPRKYNFVYGVSDPAANSIFGHQEFSNGKSIAGSYHVRLPDGRHQTVIYQDDGDGFVADVSYDHIARHPDFNLYFESTQEPTINHSKDTASSSKEAKVKVFFSSTSTTTKPTTVKPDYSAYLISRELEPPPKEQKAVLPLVTSGISPSTEPTAISSTTKASSLVAVGHKTTSHPPFRFSSYSSTTSPSPTTNTPLKKISSKQTVNSIERQARKLGDALGASPTPTALKSPNVTVANNKPVRQTPTQKSNATQPVVISKTEKPSALKASNGTLTNNKPIREPSAKIVTLQKSNTTLAVGKAGKPSTTTPEPLLLSEFSDTIFRGDFPEPSQLVTSKETTTTEEPKATKTTQKPTKKIDEVSTKETKDTTVKPETSTVKKVTDTNMLNVTGNEKKKQDNSIKATLPKTLKPASSPKKPTSFKPIITQVKIGSPTLAKPFETVAPPKTVTVARLPVLSTAKPAVTQPTAARLSIFELLDKFKPLAFRTTSGPLIRTKRSSEVTTPKSVNLFKNLPGTRKENDEIKKRMHVSIKEINNDPVFKNFVQAQRYRMVPVTLPPIKKAPRAESLKHVHIKHAIKHTPPYVPPPTTQPSAYAERNNKIMKYRVTY